MKRLILALPLALATAAVQADDQCRIYYDLGENIMGSRQAGGPIHEVMAFIPPGDEYLALLVREAYEHPRVSSKDVRDQVTTEFANRAYLDCLEAKG